MTDGQIIILVVVAAVIVMLYATVLFMWSMKTLAELEKHVAAKFSEHETQDALRREFSHYNEERIEEARRKLDDFKREIQKLTGVEKKHQGGRP